MESPIQPMLNVSTSHMPEYPDLENLRHFQTGFGVIVFVQEDNDNLPGWVRSIMRYANENNCILISFDSYNEEYAELFPIYEWQ